MKKLMLSAAIVCAAVMAHAASYNWNGSVYLEDKNGAPGVGTIEFFADGVSLGVLDVVEGALDFSFDVNLPGTISALATVTNFGTDGNITGTKPWSFDVTQTWLSEQPADTQGASLGYMVAEGLQLNWEKTLADGPAAHGYTAAPEPTSGLLLLLGVAGLALRRRRA